jgi:phosphate uptake regulator
MTASQKSEVFDNSDKDLEKRVTDLEKKLDELIKLLEKKID